MAAWALLLWLLHDLEGARLARLLVPAWLKCHEWPHLRMGRIATAHWQSVVRHLKQNTKPINPQHPAAGRGRKGTSDMNTRTPKMQAKGHAQQTQPCTTGCSDAGFTGMYS